MSWFSAGAQRHALIAVAVVAVLGGCGPALSVRNPLLSLPSSTSGAVTFSPPSGATEVDPIAAVVVRPADQSGEITRVTLEEDGAGQLAPVHEGNLYALRSGLKPDRKYTVTASATIRKKGSPDQHETQTSTFSTATTPKIVATTPDTVGSGQAVTLSLLPAAGAIQVTGEVTATLAPDGLTVTVLPKQYIQGNSYYFSLVARSLKGISGATQAAHFSSLDAATALAFPNNGSSNMGVSQPLTLTLSAPPADRAELVKALTVTAAFTPPATTPAVQPGSTCAQYSLPAGAGSGAVPFSASWLSSTRVKLLPSTPDGYWPPDATISLNAALTGVKTTGGNWFDAPVASSFQTADKRVIDVNLSSQMLTACRNGVQANQFAISSGIPRHATETGHFWIYARIQDEHMKSAEGPFAPDYYDILHVPWTQYFNTNGSALHGAWWHNNFGQPMSHGCVNVQDPTDNTQWPSAAPQAQWLWNFDNLGDPVIVYGVTPGLTAAAQPAA